MASASSARLPAIVAAAAAVRSRELDTSFAEQAQGGGVGPTVKRLLGLEELAGEEDRAARLRAQSLLAECRAHGELRLDAVAALDALPTTQRRERADKRSLGVVDAPEQPPAVAGVLGRFASEAIARGVLAHSAEASAALAAALADDAAVAASSDAELDVALSALSSSVEAQLGLKRARRVAPLLRPVLLVCSRKRSALSALRGLAVLVRACAAEQESGGEGLVMDDGRPLLAAIGELGGELLASAPWAASEAGAEAEEEREALAACPREWQLLSLAGMQGASVFRHETTGRLLPYLPGPPPGQPGRDFLLEFRQAAAGGSGLGGVGGSSRSSLGDAMDQEMRRILGSYSGGAGLTVPLYVEPDPASSVLMRLAPGEAVRVLGARGTWLRVVTINSEVAEQRGGMPSVVDGAAFAAAATTASAVTGASGSIAVRPGRRAPRWVTEDLLRRGQRDSGEEKRAHDPAGSPDGLVVHGVSIIPRRAAVQAAPLTSDGTSSEIGGSVDEEEGQQGGPSRGNGEDLSSGIVDSDSDDERPVEGRQELLRRLARARMSPAVTHRTAIAAPRRVLGWLHARREVFDPAASSSRTFFRPIATSLADSSRAFAPADERNVWRVSRNQPAAGAALDALCRAYHDVHASAQLASPALRQGERETLQQLVLSLLAALLQSGGGRRDATSLGFARGEDGDDSARLFPVAALRRAFALLTGTLSDPKVPPALALLAAAALAGGLQELCTEPSDLRELLLRALEPGAPGSLLPLLASRLAGAGVGDKTRAGPAGVGLGFADGLGSVLDVGSAGASERIRAGEILRLLAELSFRDTAARLLLVRLQEGEVAKSGPLLAEGGLLPPHVARLFRLSASAVRAATKAGGALALQDIEALMETLAPLRPLALALAVRDEAPPPGHERGVLDAACGLTEALAELAKAVPPGNNDRMTAVRSWLHQLRSGVFSVLGSSLRGALSGKVPRAPYANPVDGQPIMWGGEMARPVRHRLGAASSCGGCRVVRSPYPAPSGSVLDVALARVERAVLAAAARHVPGCAGDDTRAALAAVLAGGELGSALTAAVTTVQRWVVARAQALRWWAAALDETAAVDVAGDEPEHKRATAGALLEAMTASHAAALLEAAHESGGEPDRGGVQPPATSARDREPNSAATEGDSVLGRLMALLLDTQERSRLQHALRSADPYELALRRVEGRAELLLSLVPQHDSSLESLVAPARICDDLAFVPIAHCRAWLRLQQGQQQRQQGEASGGTVRPRRASCSDVDELDEPAPRRVAQSTKTLVTAPPPAAHQGLSAKSHWPGAATRSSSNTPTGRKTTRVLQIAADELSAPHMQYSTDMGNPSKSFSRPASPLIGARGPPSSPAGAHAEPFPHIPDTAHNAVAVTGLLTPRSLAARTRARQLYDERSAPDGASRSAAATAAVEEAARSVVRFLTGPGPSSASLRASLRELETAALSRLHALTAARKLVEFGRSSDLRTSALLVVAEALRGCPIKAELGDAPGAGPLLQRRSRIETRRLMRALKAELTRDVGSADTRQIVATRTVALLALSSWPGLEREDPDGELAELGLEAALARLASAPAPAASPAVPTGTEEPQRPSQQGSALGCKPCLRVACSEGVGGASLVMVSEGVSASPGSSSTLSEPWQGLATAARDTLARLALAAAAVPTSSAGQAPRGGLLFALYDCLCALFDERLQRQGVSSSDEAAFEASAGQLLTAFRRLVRAGSLDGREEARRSFAEHIAGWLDPQVWRVAPLTEGVERQVLGALEALHASPPSLLRLLCRRIGAWGPNAAAPPPADVTDAEEVIGAGIERALPLMATMPLLHHGDPSRLVPCSTRTSEGAVVSLVRRLAHQELAIYVTLEMGTSSSLERASFGQEDGNEVALRGDFDEDESRTFLDSAHTDFSATGRVAPGGSSPRSREVDERLRTRRSPAQAGSPPPLLPIPRREPPPLLPALLVHQIHTDTLLQQMQQTLNQTISEWPDFEPLEDDVLLQLPSRAPRWGRPLGGGGRTPAPSLDTGRASPPPEPAPRHTHHQQHGQHQQQHQQEQQPPPPPQQKQQLQRRLEAPAVHLLVRLQSRVLECSDAARPGRLKLVVLEPHTHEVLVSSTFSVHALASDASFLVRRPHDFEHDL
jgi:hypothetical protein